ncbi:uncharacterized protein LOC122510122 isoform X2 [Leptopilina heterotoma]|uniref:uncharacterized protein LOC122510122 isoform X2 n=1 Tax=Leptopilina heterotoma TaxID=63436 RepID=UPI001CA9055F|nr:uncharacterized protein LOC122510122 isoform X2 [Leptopilina heterotoma]
MASRAEKIVNMCKKQQTDDDFKEESGKMIRVQNWVNDRSVVVPVGTEPINVTKNVNNTSPLKNSVETGTYVLNTTLERNIEDPYEFTESSSEVDSKQVMTVEELMKKYDVITGTRITDITVEEDVEYVHDPGKIMSKICSPQNMTIEENSCSSFKSNTLNLSQWNDQQQQEYRKNTLFNDEIFNNNSTNFSSVSSESFDDDRDKDFNIDDCSEKSSSYLDTDNDDIDDNLSNICCSLNNEATENSTGSNNKEQMSNNEKTNAKKNNEKESWCPFCAIDVSSKNYVRHMERSHKEEKEIKNIFSFPTKSKERRKAFELFRKATNFSLYINGIVRPLRQTNEAEMSDYYPCIYCKAMIKRSFLTRHSTACSKKGLNTNKKNHRSYLSNSQTLAVCSIDPTNVISRLAVKEQVFNIMKGDAISYEAKKDLLIVQFGENYLKKHKRERKEYACSNRMRELSRLLIAYREIVHDDKVSFKDILKTRNVDNIITATRKISGYDHLQKTFNAPSLAMHMGTYLKDICDLLQQLILKRSSGFSTSSEAECNAWLKDLKHFKNLITSSWNVEISSLANKDLQEKRWNKPLLVPLVSDIKKFRDETLILANECVEKFKNCIDDAIIYKTFVHCVLALIILFNRRRIGDVQYLKIQDYEKETISNFSDFKSALSESENILTTKYKRVVNSGKGSRAVVILVPELLQKFMKILLEERKKYISIENEYVFALPSSKIKWGQGDVAIRYLTQKIELQYPEAMTSNKLRKQIATVAQILNMSKEDTRQFSKFMGHTEKTHAEFYELPVDIYQTAKVSKLLMMMEKGSLPLEFRGKSLTEINFDENSEYAEEFAEERETSALTSDGTRIDKQDSEDFQLDENMNLDSSDLTQSKKQKIKKSGWSKHEIEEINCHFTASMQKGNYPSSQEIKIFVKETGSKRSVAQIKAKIQHLFKKKNSFYVNNSAFHPASVRLKFVTPSVRLGIIHPVMTFYLDIKNGSKSIKVFY